jgi:APA family basic amino acid/polyamine antiporter
MFFSAIALWNLPVEFPEHYENATLKLRRYRGLLFAVVTGMLVSATIWAVTLIQLPIAGMLLVSWFGLGYVYYRYKLRKEGDDVGELYMRMVTLDEHEEAFAEEQTYEDATE